MDRGEKAVFYVVVIGLVVAILFLAVWSFSFLFGVLGRGLMASWARWKAIERGQEWLPAVQMTDAEGFGGDVTKDFVGNSSVFVP